MTVKTEPLFNDQFAGEPPAKRAVGYIQVQRDKGKHVAGIYCGYAPLELFYAMDLIPAVLCAFSTEQLRRLKQFSRESLPAHQVELWFYRERHMSLLFIF